MKYLALFLVFVSSAQAKTVTGKLEFNKRPPKVVLLYFNDDKSGGFKNTTVDQKNQKFVSEMFVASPGSDLKLLNSDKIVHNIFANTKKSGVKFDIGLVSPGKQRTVKVSWQEGELVKIGCVIHPKMKSYVAAIDTKHHQVIELDKSDKVKIFKLANIPNTLASLRVVIPKYDPLVIDLNSKTRVFQLMRKGKIRGSITISSSSPMAH